MTKKNLVMAQVGYGMFGSDVVAGTLWDLQRNGVSPYLDRVGLDDRARHYEDVRFELRAIGTRTADTARRACEMNRRETNYLPTPFWGDAPWTDILDRHPELDLLVVATPDHLHTAPILEALQRGVHIITEKPMCLNLLEADEIIRRAQEKDLIVGVDLHKRYDPDHLRIFQSLTRELGSPLYARGVLEEPLEVSTSIFKWAEHSDPFTYVGIHWIDLFTHYLRLRPMALYAVGQKKRLISLHGKNAFDACQVLVTHTSGLTILYENNWITPADFEGPVNQESALVGERGKVESDSQYRGLRYWIENKGSRTANTHFFRKVMRPDGSTVSIGYGKDSLIDCIERVCRKKFCGVSASEMAGTYPDAPSQRIPTAIVHAAREVLRRNDQHFQAGRSPAVTAGFSETGIRLFDPHDPAGTTLLYSKAL
ncbi:MAG: Gfo/Idh/MocA family oxidoreductase [Planctomycetes bacterium]|nr:Gfo/Idh/MocA family oxidoreductase [Planctomycetota bacterium]